MIEPRVDLHLHTTASDGRCTPRELVERVRAAGLTVMAVTDHDTTAAIAEVQRLGSACGIDVVAGIEITAMDRGRDMHVLGYFFNPDDPALLEFLARQRHARVARVEAIGDRLASLGMPIETGALLAMARQQTGKSIGRPQVARAMVDAGHVANTREAFDRWLEHGAPAFVPRSGPTPAETVEILHQAGGLVSLAHPGADQLQDRIPELAAAGFDAIEAFHSDHEPETVTQLLALAKAHNLLVTGGSDFHGMLGHGLEPGSVTLPPPEWRRVKDASTSHRPRP